MTSSRVALLIGLLGFTSLMVPTLSGLEVKRKQASAQPPLRSQPVQATPTPTPPSGFAIPEDSRPFVNAKDGGGLTVEKYDEEVRVYSGLGLTFPSPMVTADKIDLEGIESPVSVWPPLDVNFFWRTTVQGDLFVKGPVIPAQTYRFRLRDGLANAEGVALLTDVWGVEMQSPPLRIIECDYGERDSLNARPQVPVEFNYPVDLSTAAEGAWFQDRVSRARFPAEILLNHAESPIAEGETIDASGTLPEKVYSFRYRPVRPLPVGRSFDLVVDGVRDAYAGRGMVYPRVFPLGKTRPIEIKHVVARNEPFAKPHIEVKFSAPLSEGALSPDAVRISPPVANLKLRKEGNLLLVDGAFKVPERYEITISDQVIGASGYGLAAPAKWGATFRPFRPVVLFPDRVLRERPALGFRFAFHQVNTGPLTWRLAEVPFDQLATVRQRLTEFDAVAEDAKGNSKWAADGRFLQPPTELLIDALGLPVVGEGTLPGSETDREELRLIAWKPLPPKELSGPVLFEVSGTDSSGRLVGNRALVWFGDLAITRKSTTDGSVIRVADMATGKPVAGAEVFLYDRDWREMARRATDASGLVFFDSTEFAPCEALAASVGGRISVQPLWLQDSFPAGTASFRPPPDLRAFTFTDRPLYRPGQPIHFKGFIREKTAAGLSIPSPATVAWKIMASYGSEVFASGEMKLGSDGSWHGEWTPPEAGRVGDFLVKVTVGGVPAGVPANFKIEEFRNPPFSVACREDQPRAPGESVITVQSQYFHGAPNAGARVRWKATWYGDSEDGYYYNEEEGVAVRRVDLLSEGVKAPSFMAEEEGEGVLNLQGQLVLSSKAPFADYGNRARSFVSWKVDVTGPDGQTITGGTQQHVAMVPVLLGLFDPRVQGSEVTFRWDALTPFGKAPEAVSAEVFHVTTKSIRERLAPNVYRYRNFDVYTSVARLDRVTKPEFQLKAAQPGRYVAVIKPLGGGEGIPVSVDAYVSGDGDAELPIENDISAQVFSLRASPDRKEAIWYVGETARLNVLAPTGGVAWVSVETDRILDTFTVPLTGSASTIDIPIKAEYEPNAYVSIYLLNPGGSDQLAGEMFGYTNLEVRQKERALDVQVMMDAGQVQPGEKITGSVQVLADSQPVAGADLAVFGVDDSILELGGWKLPEIFEHFFPPRPYAVQTYTALKAYVDKILPSWLTSKGFVVGGGGEDEFGNVLFTRKDFKPLILWLPNVKTDAQGRAVFSCEAPDNLTRFRFIAIGQTAASQFGGGSNVVEVSKKLSVEAALPRFLRQGDEVELRAVVRQKMARTDQIRIRCQVGVGIELIDDAVQEVSAAKDAPMVVRFRAKATALGSSSIKFEAVSLSGEKLNDAVEITLPVVEPTILQKESVAGTWNQRTFSPSLFAPASWKDGTGTFTLALSTTPWLAKLMGIPFLLDYPHGCFEQKSSRLLAYTYLAGLLEYLPEDGKRAENYGEVISSVLREFEASLLPGGDLPYWPMGTLANDYVTIQAAWCVLAAEQAGFTVPERLASDLPEALNRILHRQSTRPASQTLRAFALFVLSSMHDEGDEAWQAAAEDIYLHRDHLTGEGRALLALAFHGMNLAPDKQAQLVKELPTDFADISFNPETFASATRTEALCSWARLAITPDADHGALLPRLEKLMESSSSLSTQENLWLLVAFDALLESSRKTPMPSSVKPRPAFRSSNSTAVSWTPEDLARLAEFAVSGLPRAEGSFVLQAAYRTSERLPAAVSQGLTLERVVKNLTDPKRVGTPEAPIKLGDEILISYRFSTDKPQSYVALEDSLPAGLEVLNPNLAMIGKLYTLPPEEGVETAGLSFSEMRDKQTNLYFDEVAKGRWGYSVLARATAVGRFIWPATQITPMYDSRFYARSAASECVVTE